MQYDIWRRCLPLIVFIASFITPASSQILPSRNLMAAPLADTGGAFGLLARSHFFGEGARGFTSAGDDRAWDATIGGFADLYRGKTDRHFACGLPRICSRIH